MSVETVAMHMSDGIVNAPTSILFLAVAVVALAVSAWRARTELDDRTVPFAVLVTAFVFAVQMVNFPVLPGVSGHLLGGALAAILLGPFTAALSVAIVLVVQALVFADGGIAALGTNITNLAVLGVLAGYGTAVLCGAVLRGRDRAGSVAALGGVAFVAALVATMAAAAGFVVQYALGGASGVSLGTVAAAVFGTHLAIGVGEGVITALTVMAVATARPDLIALTRRAAARPPVSV